MELERAREDVLVAASAGATTVALALVSGVAGVADIATLPTLAPLAVYAVYLFSRKGGPYGPLDRARNWAIAAVGIGAAVLVAAAVA